MSGKAKYKSLTSEQIHGLYASLASKSLLQTGIEFGLDKRCKNEAGVRNTVGYFRRKVLANPEKYGVSHDLIDTVEKSIERRKDSSFEKANNKSLAEKLNYLDDMDDKQLMFGIAKKAMKLMHKKLDRADKSKKELDKLNYGYLNNIMGTAFDKSQILKGQATENIAVYGHIEGEVTPEKLHEISRQVLERQLSKTN